MAILDGKALPVIEICAPEGSYDFQNKYYTDVVRYECPAKLPEASAKALAAACESLRSARLPRMVESRRA